MKAFAPIAFTAALAAPVIPTTAQAWVLDNVVSIENTGGVEVILQDSAVGGCWTNLGEVKTYAEDKLKERGYSVDQKSPKQMNLLIAVNSERVSDGTCYGAVFAKLIAPAELKHSEGTAYAILGEVSTTYTGHKNANIVVLDLVKTLIDDMPGPAS
ncbi:hypothetical protein [Ruegeria arenilitoris]|uniref:hypothetical protein n=1 Tax=Ruegeria arenilitoris TaxID=1173585 RepID=UPI00147E8697|nr:hypothetical protein [Ruegeria arenilitoris]